MMMATAVAFFVPDYKNFHANFVPRDITIM